MYILYARSLIVTVLFFFLVASCATTPKHYPSDINRGLVAYWPMDKVSVDGSMIKDQLGKYNGIRKGGISLIKGPIREAIEFNGKDGYVDFGNILNNVFTSGAVESKNITYETGINLDVLWNKVTNPSEKGNKFSIAMWVYPTKKAQQVNVVIKSGHSHCMPQKNERMFGVYMGNAARGDNSLSFGLETNHLGANLHSDTKLALPLNQWTHFVANYDESANSLRQRITIWINGLEQRVITTNSGDFVLQPSPAMLALGVAVGSDGSPCDLGGKDPYYAGAIDDLRVYSRLLSKAEVSQLVAMGEGEISNLSKSKYE